MLSSFLEPPLLAIYAARHNCAYSRQIAHSFQMVLLIRQNANVCTRNQDSDEQITVAIEVLNLYNN